MVPILDVDEIETTPHTSEKKTKGTMTSLKEAINIWPTTSKRPSVKKSIRINCPNAPRKPESFTNLRRIPPTIASTMDNIILEVRVITNLFQPFQSLLSLLRSQDIPNPQEHLPILFRVQYHHQANLLPHHKSVRKQYIPTFSMHSPNSKKHILTQLYSQLRLKYQSSESGLLVNGTKKKNF